MTPNRNGLLECRDCGESVHVKHAKGGRCSTCAADDLVEWAPYIAPYISTLVTGQPAFTPSYAVSERYATDGRYGGYVGVEVVKGSGVYVLEAEEQEEVAT